MQSFGNIVVFHPAAIGDALLATPVVTTLKQNFPAAKLTYWSHPELKQLLLGLCPSIDEFVDYVRESSFFDILRSMERLKPDLFVDLSNSGKTRMLPWFTRRKILRYRKQSPHAEVIQHAVHNFLETIHPVCSEFPAQFFPTIFPDALAEEVLPQLLEAVPAKDLPFIGLVPGVGRHRPHRAWIPDGWIYLLRFLVEQRTYLPVIIGGEEDIPLCDAIVEQFKNDCLNVVGKLSLPQTAAVLKKCQVVVAGDTGPAHLAVAVGTPVIGLYGPTFPARSGPYNCEGLIIDQSAACRCHGNKVCLFARPDAPGE
ncbi:MAG TPA: glycosyltransferase family 9 protein, partial [Candidatus Obscuribacterales bacterium]